MENLTYEEFIQNILDIRGRFACGDEYHERHHIVPICLGGGDEKENLIDLFAKEHFIAHKLLALENPNNDKLIYAWNCMAFAKRNYQERYELTSEEYEEARVAVSQAMKGKIFSDETRQKMSESAKERCTEEWRIKSSKSQSGLKRPQCSNPCSDTAKEVIRKKNSKAVYQKTLDGDIINMFTSQSEAERITGVAQASIWRCCNNKAKSAGGYDWGYVDSYNEPHKNRLRKVIQLDFDWNYICEWECATYAENALDIANGKVTSCCNDRRQSAGGYKWRYKEDWDKLQLTVKKRIGGD